MKGRTPIGIDFGRSRVKAAQLVRRRGGWRLSAWACYDRCEEAPAPSAREMDRLLGALERGGFAGDSVVLGAPSELVRTAVVDAPPRSSGAPIEQICGAQFAQMFRSSPAAFEMHMREIPSGTDRGGACQVSVCGVASEEAAGLAAPFDRVGLRVEGIDLAEEALSRACVGACAAEEGLTSLLDIGGGGVGLAVFLGGEALYHRRLEGLGVGRLVREVAKSLRVDADAARVLVDRVGLGEAPVDGADGVTASRVQGMAREYVEVLLRDMLRSLAYVLDRYPGESVARVRLTGGGASLPGLAEYFEELGGIEARRIGADACGVSGAPAGCSGALVTAIGHAMWGGEVG